MICGSYVDVFEGRHSFFETQSYLCATDLLTHPILLTGGIRVRQVQPGKSRCLCAALGALVCHTQMPCGELSSEFVAYGTGCCCGTALRPYIVAYEPKQY